MSGPLEGLKIIEIAGIGPGPFCAMMLADMGADVVRVDRAQNVSGGDPASPPADVLNRGRRSIGVDLKHPDGVEAVLALVEQADGLIEGFRPGVMERLGLGPDACPRPQPAARLRPHDRLGPGRPVRPGRRPRHQLHRARRRPRPDRPARRAAGAAAQPGRRLRRRRHAARLRHGLRPRRARSAPARARWSTPPWSTAPPCSPRCSTPSGPWASGRTSGAPTCSTPAPTTTTSTRRPTASTCRSARSSRSSTRSSSASPASRARSCPWQQDRTAWPDLKERLAEIFKAKTRDEWCEIMEGTDVCFAPVLSLGEAPAAPAQRRTGARSSSSTASCSRRRRPASPATPVEVQRPPAHAGQHTDEVLTEWGLDADRVAKLREAGAIA